MYFATLHSKKLGLASRTMNENQSPKHGKRVSLPQQRASLIVRPVALQSNLSNLKAYRMCCCIRALRRLSAVICVDA